MHQPSIAFILLTAGSSSALISLWLHRRREQQELVCAPQGSLGLWALGEMLDGFLTAPSEFFAKRIARYGKNFTSHIMLNPLVFVGEPQDREMILTSEAKGLSIVSWPQHWKRLMGKNSVSVAIGKDHTRMRRLMAPFLTPGASKGYLHAVDQCVKEWLQCASKQQQSVLSTDEFKNLSIWILFQTVFAGNATKEEIALMKHDFELYIDGYLALCPIPIGEFNCMGRAIHARARLVKLINDIMERFQRRGEEGKDQGGLLEAMINSRDEDSNNNGLSHNEILDNLVVICFAGFDTLQATFGTLTSLVFAESNAHILNKLRDEVGFKDGDLDFDELRNLPWLNACIDEALRFRAPINMGIRQAIKDIALADGQTMVPQGMRMAYYPSASHFDKDFWGQDALEFNPQRFLQLNDPERIRQHLLPFGRGVRVCPGENLAKLELRVFLFRIVQLYNIQVLSSQKVGFPMNMVQCQFRITNKLGYKTS